MLNAAIGSRIRKPLITSGINCKEISPDFPTMAMSVREISLQTKAVDIEISGAMHRDHRTKNDHIHISPICNADSLL
jgi:hypothetical protein